MKEFNRKSLAFFTGFGLLVSCSPRLEMKRSQILNPDEIIYEHHTISGCVLDKRVISDRKSSSVTFCFDKNSSSGQSETEKILPDSYGLIVQTDDSSNILYIDGESEDYRCLFEKVELGDFVTVDYCYVTERKSRVEYGQINSTLTKRLEYTDITKN